MHRFLVSLAWIVSASLVLITCLVGFSAPVYAGSSPTQAYYVAGSTDFYTLGKNQTGSGAVILDFGKQVISSGTYYAVSPVDGSYITLTSVGNDVQSYVNGYNAYRSQHIAVLVGTNNCGLDSYTDSQVVSFADQWNKTVNSVNGGSYVGVYAASDIEGGYSSPTKAEWDWDKEFSNLGSTVYDYGDAALGNYWTVSDYYNVAWGFSASQAFPEIYSDGDADQPNYDVTPPNGTNNTLQWQQVSLNGGTYGSIYFAGVLNEAFFTPYVDDNSTGEAVDNFISVLNSNSKTAQSSINWFDNI